MGNLYIVATPIGNLEDITKRAIQILNTVDIILCEDTRTSSHLLNSLNIKTKLMSYHKYNEIKRTSEIIDLLKKGLNLALITDAGTPCISDPGSILINEAIKNNILVYSLPGPSALITALTLSGLNINNFAFYGFLDRKKTRQQQQLKEIYNNDLKIVIFYESPKRIIETLENINLIMTDPYIIVLNDLTKKFEKKYYGKSSLVIKELLANPNYTRGEYVIIVSKDKKIEPVNEITPEALLIDKMIKEKCSLKDAISLLAIENNKYSKNELYNASLNIKKILN